jgi:hypothetical protein
MTHTTTLVLTKQISDEQFAICVGCCGLYGQVTNCTMPADATQCPLCAAHLMSSLCGTCGLKTHPGCQTCKAAGHVHAKDTRSWHTMHSSVINDETKLADSLKWKHTNVAANHEAALQAEAQLQGLVGIPVQSDAQSVAQMQ